MALTSRRRRPLDRSGGHVRDAKLVIVAVEGEKTEKQYFALFRNVRVQVRVLTTGEDHASAPEHVLARLDEFRNAHEFESGDEFWFLTDVDRWGAGKLSRVARKAVQRGYELAISRPCFECWLFLHFANPPGEWTTCQQFKAGMRARLGSYNPSNLSLEEFRGHLDDAIRRAKALDPNPKARWPDAVGSHVYRLVERLLSS